MTPAAALAKITRTCAILSGVAILLMMLAGAADIFGTNLDVIGLRSQPIPATFEFMGAMMVVTVFLAVSYTQHKRGHIRVEVLVKRMPGWMRKVSDILRHLFSVLVFGLIAWCTWPAAIHAFNVGEYATGLVNFPLWPARFVLAFGVTLMTAQCIFDLLGIWFKGFYTPDSDKEDSAQSHI